MFISFKILVFVFCHRVHPSIAEPYQKRQRVTCNSKSSELKIGSVVFGGILQKTESFPWSKGKSFRTKLFYEWYKGLGKFWQTQHQGVPSP